MIDGDDFPFVWVWEAELDTGETRNELAGDDLANIDLTQVAAFRLLSRYNGYPHVELVVNEDKRVVFHRRQIGGSTFASGVALDLSLSIPALARKITHVLGWVKQDDPEICAYLLLEENGKIYFTDNPDAA